MSGERQLLEAVVEALTLPHDVPDYSQRIEDRAMVVKVVVGDALAGNPADLAWNADWLRAKVREEEARYEGGKPTP